MAQQGHVEEILAKKEKSTPSQNQLGSDKSDSWRKIQMVQISVGIVSLLIHIICAKLNENRQNNTS